MSEGSPGPGDASALQALRAARQLLTAKLDEVDRLNRELLEARLVAESAVRDRSAFFANMSHEIRTPMNAVIGMTSILLDSSLTTGQREAAEVIRASGEHLLTIINDILDFSKIEAGKLTLEQAPFPLRDCVEGTLDLVAAAAARGGVEVGYLIEAGTPEGILGDVGRLRQILLNLLSNAVKFTPSGGHVMIEVRAVPLDGGKSLRVEFAVVDTGVGIRPEVLSRLFTPFTQADVATTRRYGGTGLGLSISKRLVELMGGTIQAESTPGAGSRFSFRIVTEAAPVAAVRYVPADVEPQLRGRRVLVVDDLEINRRILLHYVDHWGMTARATALPAEALDWIARGETFDLAMLDFNMPGMDGVELARGLRAAIPASRMPIVILSSVSLETVDRGLVDATLLKPIKPARLLEIVGNLVVGTPRTPRKEAASSDLPRELGREHPLKLLVVEDNSVNQRVARLLLEKVGYVADFAANGEEALTAVARQGYDVVFMDVQMPVMDGLTATRELCRLFPAPERPRIIGMTANASDDDRRACELAGMDDYLSKPVRPEVLVAALRRSSRRGATKAASDDFSRDGLDELRRVYDVDGATEIIGALLEDFAARRDELTAAVAAREAPGIRRIAHIFKTGARMVGALQLGNHCERVERVAWDGSLDVALALVPDMVGRYATLLDRVKVENARTS